jgi:hypothetical protein
LSAYFVVNQSSRSGCTRSVVLVQLLIMQDVIFDSVDDDDIIRAIAAIVANQDTWRNQNLRRAPVIESWAKCVGSRVV